MTLPMTSSLSSENLQTLIRTFTSVFPNTYLVSSRPDVDLLLLGSKTEMEPDFQIAAERMRGEFIMRDLADRRVGIRDVYDFAARFRMGPKELKTLAGSGPLHTDNLPVVAYTAPKNLYINTDQANMRLLNQHAVGIAPYIKLKTDNREEFLKKLTLAYQRFLPGGKESDLTQQLLKKLAADSSHVK